MILSKIMFIYIYDINKYFKHKARKSSDNQVSNMSSKLETITYFIIICKQTFIKKYIVYKGSTQWEQVDGFIFWEYFLKYQYWSCWRIYEQVNEHILIE